MNIKQRILQLINEENEDTPSFGDDSETSSNPSSEQGDVPSDSGSQDNEESPSDDTGDNGDNEGADKSSTDNEKSDDNDNEKDEEDEKEEEFKATSMDDLLKQTNTKIEIKQSTDTNGNPISEPSPIFGLNNTNNHNKYSVSIKNDNGVVNFDFYDSIKNTKNKSKPTRDQILKLFGRDMSMLENGDTKEKIYSTIGYDKVDGNVSQKEFDGCQKRLQDLKKIFEENQLSEFLRLATH